MGARFEGDWMVFGVEVRRVRVHRLGGARRGFLRLILANRYLPPPYFPSFLTADRLPLHRVADLIRQALGIRPVVHQDRVAPLLNGAVDVRTEHEAIVHRDRYVPVDAHPVPHLGLVAPVFVSIVFTAVPLMAFLL